MCSTIPTRNVLVVAVQVSQHNCVDCGQAPHTAQASNSSASWMTQSICEFCGIPQPLRSDEDYFSIFAVPVRFAQDRTLIEKRFYELSRLLHPDRFVQKSRNAQIRSNERMGFLNQAYSTLKDPRRLRDYVLGRERIQAQKQVPMEIVEAWFEIQEGIQDGISRSATWIEQFKAFETSLAAFQKSVEQTLLALESAYDHQPSQSILEELAQSVQTQSYLNSLEKDVERIKKNAHSN